MSRAIFGAHSPNIQVDLELTEPAAKLQAKMAQGKPFVETPLTESKPKVMTADELWSEFCEFYGVKMTDPAVHYARYGRPASEANEKTAEMTKRAIDYFFASRIDDNFGSYELARIAMAKTRDHASIDKVFKLSDSIKTFRFDRAEKQRAIAESNKLVDVFIGRNAQKIIDAIEEHGQLTMPSWAKLVVTCMPQLEKSVGLQVTPQNMAMLLASVGHIKKLHDKLPVAMRSPIADYLKSLPGLTADGSPSEASLAFHKQTVSPLVELLTETEQEATADTN